MSRPALTVPRGTSVLHFPESCLTSLGPDNFCQYDGDAKYLTC